MFLLDKSNDWSVLVSLVPNVEYIQRLEFLLLYLYVIKLNTVYGETCACKETNNVTKRLQVENI